MPIVATDRPQTNASAIPVLSAIHTKFAVHRRRTPAVLPNVVVEVNVVSRTIALIAFALMVMLAIRTLNATISMNALTTHVAQTRYALTPPAVTTANANPAPLAIPSLCALKFLRIFAKIQHIAHANLISLAHRATPAKMDVALISANTSLVALEQLAHKAIVCVLLVTSAIQTIFLKDVTFADNVKSIKIVKTLKFASNSVAAFANVLTLAANSSVDRMLCAFRAIIDLRAFAQRASSAIQMISNMDVNQRNESLYPMCVSPMSIAQPVMFACQRRMVFMTVSIPARKLPVETTKSVI